MGGWVGGRARVCAWLSVHTHLPHPCTHTPTHAPTHRQRPERYMQAVFGLAAVALAVPMLFHSASVSDNSREG